MAEDYPGSPVWSLDAWVVDGTVQDERVEVIHNPQSKILAAVLHMNSLEISFWYRGEAASGASRSARLWTDWSHCAHDNS